MTAKSALITILLGGIAFACCGALVGACVASLAPDYYRVVFHLAGSRAVDPLHIGIGLGITQGAATGIAISIALVALLAWRDIRVQRRIEAKEILVAGQLVRAGKVWSVHALWGLTTTICMIVVAAIAFVSGGIIGQAQLYQAWTDRKLDRIAKILDAGEFKGVEAQYSSAAQVYLTGTINSGAARDALHGQLLAAFGAEEAEAMLRCTDVAN